MNCACLNSWPFFWSLFWNCKQQKKYWDKTVLYNEFNDERLQEPAIFTLSNYLLVAGEDNLVLFCVFSKIHWQMRLNEGQIKRNCKNWPCVSLKRPWISCRKSSRINDNLCGKGGGDNLCVYVCWGRGRWQSLWEGEVTIFVGRGGYDNQGLCKTRHFVSLCISTRS